MKMKYFLNLWIFILAVFVFAGCGVAGEKVTVSLPVGGDDYLRLAIADAPGEIGVGKRLDTYLGKEFYKYTIPLNKNSTVTFDRSLIVSTADGLMDAFEHTEYSASADLKLNTRGNEDSYHVITTFGVGDASVSLVSLEDWSTLRAEFEESGVFESGGIESFDKYKSAVELKPIEMGMEGRTTISIPIGDNDNLMLMLTDAPDEMGVENIAAAGVDASYRYSIPINKNSTVVFDRKLEFYIREFDNDSNKYVVNRKTVAVLREYSESEDLRMSTTGVRPFFWIGDVAVDLIPLEQWSEYKASNQNMTVKSPDEYKS